MISVVTITFNNPAELKDTLNSLKEVQSIESIVIDGGDHPESRQFLQNYPGTVVQEKDQGISDAFNKGVRHAKGSAVAFLNSGDILIDENYYSCADEFLSKNSQIGFVYSDILFVNPHKGEQIMKPRGLETAMNLGRGMPFPHPSMVVRREVFDQIGLFSLDFKIAMDFDFVVRLLAAGVQGHYYGQKPTVRMNGDGVSTLRERQGISECKNSLILHGEFDWKNRLGYYTRIFRYKIRRFVDMLKGI